MMRKPVKVQCCDNIMMGLLTFLCRHRTLLLSIGVGTFVFVNILRALPALPRRRRLSRTPVYVETDSIAENFVRIPKIWYFTVGKNFLAC